MSEQARAGGSRSCDAYLPLSWTPRQRLSFRRLCLKRKRKIRRPGSRLSVALIVDSRRRSATPVYGSQGHSILFVSPPPFPCVEA